jgi:eukaryotic-like serine/threonine-protein kinase
MKLTSTEWRRMSELLDEALALPTAALAEWLRGLGGADALLADSLRELLVPIGAGRDPLDRPPDFAGALLADAVRRDDPPIELAAGSTIGVYRLVRELGRGGMSAVWLAERVDGRLRRQVALKFPYAGPAQRQFAERLVRERDILAGLEHPNIARLYDADVTAGGQPFLVLEFVDGIPIDAYCDAHRLTLRERLVLFLQVLQAVHYAHARLVIHRDLKPSNVLVTGERVVRLLDFGISTLEREGTQLESALTRFGGRPLTPDYASPEQVSGEAVTTASDVYSLGVVLYELLAGRRPYRLQRESAAVLEEAIANADVEPLARAPVTSTIAAARGSERGKLERQLRGDLDRIVGKALRRGAEERYAGADALAQDLRRFLDGEPVLAQAQSFSYRMRRYVARHRVAAAALATIVFAILLGAGLALWQANEAREQRDRAVRALGRNEAMVDFMGLMLTEAAATDEPLSIPKLLERSERILEQGGLRDSDQTAAALGVLASYHTAFDDLANADRLLTRARTLAAGSREADLRAVLGCRQEYTRTLRSPDYSAMPAIDTLLAELHDAPLAAAVCHEQRALVAQAHGAAEAALDSARRALAEFRRSGSTQPVFEAELLGTLGYSYHLTGDAQSAGRYMGDAWERLRALGREGHPVAIFLLENRASAALAVGDVIPAARDLEEAGRLATRHGVRGRLPASLLANRAVANYRLGRLDLARRDYEASLASAMAMKDSSAMTLARSGLGRVALAEGDMARAQSVYDEVAAQAATGASQLVRTNVKYFGGLLAARRGHCADAERIFTQQLRDFALRGVKVGVMTQMLDERARCRVALGDAAGALADANSAVALARELQVAGRPSAFTGTALLELARLLGKRGEPDAAQAAARAAYQELRAAVGDDHADTRAARNLAGA